MNKTLKLATLVLCSAASFSAFAAKPTSIKYVEDVVMSDDEIYSRYTVTCSNGKTADVSAWDNRKLWCPGLGSKDNCSKKQIKIAKKVCKK